MMIKKVLLLLISFRSMFLVIISYFILKENNRVLSPIG